jgi:glycosyltransferase involved in cell wall biosynthesis
MMAVSKISIVTPVFSGAKYLEDTILSVINQGYPNLEYIIIDGGRTDGTVDIIKKYEIHLAYWLSEPYQGLYYAVQKGFEKHVLYI